MENKKKKYQLGRPLTERNNLHPLCCREMPLKIELKLNSFLCYVQQLENEYSERGKMILFAWRNLTNFIKVFNC